MIGTATEIEGETEEIDMVEDVMTDVSPLERDTVAIVETSMTIREILPVMKMIGVETIEAHVKMGIDMEDVHPVKTWILRGAVVGAGEVEGEERVIGMAWGLLRGGHRRRKVLYLCHSEKGRLLVGMFMHRGTSSTPLCKPNRQVTACYKSDAITLTDLP
jgi:hypothetical protein